ncbi:hypothetical protein [Actinophytocola gossypii]|uniref:Uncharacterized protein n=1 Tax=Actinophytocola gossypii TaxID=2812003 RepID=A0ABT2J2Z3_9PSEU|nr:hypothetical protein [Actinophytocola gossypii]MCT2582225.1 hypothetical protein [Actinophytocola gossypii]
MPGSPKRIVAVHEKVALARKIANKETHEFDIWLGEPLLSEQFATARLDRPGATAAAKTLCASIPA